MNRSEEPIEGHMQRTVLWVAVGIFVGFTLAGCGGRAVQASGLDELVGYWQVPGQGPLQVREVDGRFAVGGSFGQPQPVRQVSGRLLLFKGRVISQAQSVQGGELAWEQGRAILLYFDPVSRAVRQKVSLTRLTKSDYAKAAVTYANYMTKVWSYSLATLIARWAKQHGGTPPAPAAMIPGSLFGRFVIKQGEYGSHIWPPNPFTGKPMRAGTDPGDFAYSASGSSYKLVAHLSGGQNYAAP